MKNRIHKWRQDRLCGKIVESGRQLNRLRQARTVSWPDDAQVLDEKITVANRRHRQLLQTFKEGNQ